LVNLVDRYNYKWAVRSVETLIPVRPIRPDNHVLFIESIIRPVTVHAVSGSNNT